MSVREEFEGAEFGDKRLSERILKLSECFSRWTDPQKVDKLHPRFSSS